MNGRFVGLGRCDDIFIYCGCLSRCRCVDLTEGRDRKFVDISPGCSPDREIKEGTRNEGQSVCQAGTLNK